jgi:AcrR family transcriptional regulator
MATPEPPTAGRPARDPDPVRERLISGALTVLRTEGPAQLTVRRIAATAGSTTMGLYSRFGSREGLLDALYLRGFQMLESAMLDADVSGEPPEAVRNLLHAYRKFALDNSALYAVLFERVLPGFDPTPESRETALQATFALLAHQTGRLVRDDAHSQSSREFAYVLWAHTHGLVSLELTHSLRGPMPAGSLAAEADGFTMLDAALRATLAGWPLRAAA